MTEILEPVSQKVRNPRVYRNEFERIGVHFEPSELAEKINCQIVVFSRENDELSIQELVTVPCPEKDAISCITFANSDSIVSLCKYFSKRENLQFDKSDFVLGLNATVDTDKVKAEIDELKKKLSALKGLI